MYAISSDMKSRRPDEIKQQTQKRTKLHKKAVNTEAF